MTLVKTSILAFIATVIKLLSGLIISKAIAIYIGPSGLALIGQFQNFIQIVMMVASGAINTGVTKYTAEYGIDNKKIPILFSTSSKISITSSVIVALIIVIFSKSLSLNFLKSEQYTYIFIIFGFTLALFVVNNLLLSILNGLKEIKLFIKLGIIQSLYSLVFTTLLIAWLGLDGALIALVTNQSVIFIVNLFLLKKHKTIQLEFFRVKFCKHEARNLFAFAVMGIIGVVTLPISNLIVRNYLGETLGWEKAGYWQAITNISTMYLSVISTVLGIYFLPKLSELKKSREIKNELIKGCLLITAFTIPVSILIYYSRDLILILLFTSDFKEVRDLFLWQLIGDFFKAISFLLAYYMISKKLTMQYIIIQVLFPFIFIILCYFLINYFMTLSPVISYAITYSLCFIYMIIIVKSSIQKNHL